MQHTYPKNFELKIGFNRIREQIKGNCLSVLGQEWVDNISFQTDKERIKNQLDATSEFVAILQNEENFPTNHFFDLRSVLNNINIEGRFLEVEDLFDLKRSLETIRAIVHFFGKRDKDDYTILKEKAKDVQIFPYIYQRIDTIINKLGKLRDNASPELARIRKEILQHQSSMSKRLHAILKKAQKDGYVEEDASIAIRDGRAVIPISTYQKRKIKGIVYDESATGKTSYVEPNEIVEMNNEVRELEYAERREIIKILTDFSNDIRPYLDELKHSYCFLGEIDFIRAKARYATQMECVQPHLSDELLIEWYGAVHPILKQTLQREKKKIVPLNIELSQEKHILVISGPNAGGKSVCLKTVGLVQYMLQCGMLVPMLPDSRSGIFKKIFIDIGDEQSLDNDLSTYSSHLQNMKYFVRNCDEQTLILIDEFGTGTEPILGGAIAEAILEKFNQLNTFGVITTHYSNLKHFASSADGIANGAMLYDSQNMQPLFQLEMSKPGSSFAFEIARKIGLPEEILQNATEKIGQDHIDFDKNLRRINRDKSYWENKRRKIRKVEKMLDDMSEKYQSELKETEKKRKEILAKAKIEADQLLMGVNKRIENTIEEIKVAQAEKEKTLQAREKIETLKEDVQKEGESNDEFIERKMQQLRAREARRNRNRSTKKPIKLKPVKKEKPLEVGDKVNVEDQTTIGELIELNDKNAVVGFGQLIMTIDRKKLKRVSKNEAKKVEKQRMGASKLTSNFSEKRINFKSEIDIRGQRAEEAINNIQQFLDEAIMFGHNKLRILHGKGNGILKETVRNFLRTEPIVESFKDEHVDFGGAGITIVNLDL